MDAILNPRFLIFFSFDLGIVISHLKILIFISVRFKQETSNLVKIGHHIESAILNFSILIAES